jgi:cytochrome c oxidase subunit 2
MKIGTVRSSLGAALLFGWVQSVHAEMALNLQTPQTALGHTIYGLHTLILIICLIIFVLVFGAMFYAIWKHRKSVGHKAAHFHENTTVEIIWTIIPFFILIGMAVPATKTLLAERDTSVPDMTIKVTGYQWKWHYDYLQDGVSFYSTLATPRDQIENLAPKGENYLLEVDNPVVVPIGKKVRVIVTAGDVLHAWFVPALYVKQDAVPGFIRDTWFKVESPGVYRGQCAELCGKEHGFMPIVVKAVSEEDYKQWVAEQKSKQGATAAAPVQVAAADTAAKSDAASAKVDGKATYQQICQVCHAAALMGAPKPGDKAAWAPRIAQGLPTLHEHANKGIRSMPAKGGNPSLSDDQVNAAVDYMVSLAK